MFHVASQTHASSQRALSDAELDAIVAGTAASSGTTGSNTKIATPSHPVIAIIAILIG